MLGPSLLKADHDGPIFGIGPVPQFESSFFFTLYSLQMGNLVLSCLELRSFSFTLHKLKNGSSMNVEVSRYKHRRRWKTVFRSHRRQFWSVWEET